MNSPCFVIALLTLYLPGVAALARTAPVSPDDNQQPSSMPGLFMSAGAGSFEPDTGGSVTGRERGIATFLDAGYQFNPYFALAGDLAMYWQDYATPYALSGCLFCTVDDEVSVTTLSFSLTGKASYPFWRLRPYAGAGIGFFRSTALLEGTLLGIPGELSEKADSGLGVLVIGGLDLKISPACTLGLEYRRTHLSADFGELSEGSVDIGGAAMMLTWRWFFSRPFHQE